MKTEKKAKDKEKKKAKDKTPKAKAELPEKEQPKTLPGHEEEIKRLNRAAGQIEGLKKMLDSGRPLNDILIQFKAVHSALRSIEKRVFEIYVENCVNDITAADKRKDRDGKIAELTELYRQM